MCNLLYYLVTIKGVDRVTITEGYYSMTELLPQEYLYYKIGKIFSDLKRVETVTFLLKCMSCGVVYLLSSVQEPLR